MAKKRRMSDKEANFIRQRNEIEVWKTGKPYVETEIEKEAREMSENNYEDHAIHVEEPIVVENNEIVEHPELVVEESPAPPNEAEVQDQQVVNNVEPQQVELPKGDKPAWSYSKHHVLSVKRHGFTVDRGPEVDYVNKLLGVGADSFTRETGERLLEWRKENKVPGSREVRIDDYRRM